MNVNDINAMMRQLTQLMDGNIEQSMQRLSQLQQMFPNQVGPILPLQGTSGEAINLNLQQLHSMLDKLHSFVNEDLMRSMYNLQSYAPTTNATTAQRKAFTTVKSHPATIPIQLWENESQLYIIASVPGVKSREDIKVSFLDERLLRLRVKYPQPRLPRNSRLIQSDFPKNILEREVDLPHAVSTKSYSSTMSDGLYTLTLYKLEEDIEIPIFDE